MCLSLLDVSPISQEIGTTELLARGVNLSVLAIGEVSGRLHIVHG